MSVKVKNVLDALQQMQKSLECSICLELLKDPHSTKCNHQFCGQCIKQVLEKSSKKSKNKWYCPLCKTPVSKRSLTPNPKLSEIVAAVRGLQGAVQDDTGIPTGSPPPQPFKSFSSTAGTSGCTSSSSHHPTPHKRPNNSKATKTRVAKKNQFNVYHDNDENNILDNIQPQVVSNVNIRSTLGPALIQTTTSSTKPNKAPNTKTTRRTRNSRRIAQKNYPDETLNEKNVSEELLHMIDTLPFQPVSKEVVGPTCAAQDDAPLADEVTCKSNKMAAPSHASSLQAKTTSTVDNRPPASEEKCPSASVQPQKATCLTTIAEADSSIRMTPCDNAPTCANNDTLPLCVNTTTEDKEYEGAVSSTKFDSCPLSSLDTMQSVSILPSQDCCEQQYDDDEDQKRSSLVNEDAHSRDIKANELIATDSCLAEYQDQPFISCKERQTSDQSINTKLPSGSTPSAVKDPPLQSLDGLVHLVDDPTLTNPTETSQEAEEKAAERNLGLSKLGSEKDLPQKVGCNHEDEVDHQSTETDLCERVKQRQRRRTPEISLQSNRRSDPTKKSLLQLRTKTKKRSADSVTMLTHDETSPEGNARKKFKNSPSPLPTQASQLKENKERRLPEVSGLSSECKGKEEEVLIEDGSLSFESRSCSSGKTILSSEVVPASVSSSEKLISPVINPMIAHVNQALEGVQKGSTGDSDEWGSQKIRENGCNAKAKKSAVQKAGANVVSPQIKPVWDKENLKHNKPSDKENDVQDQVPEPKERTSGVSSSKQQFSMTSSRVDTSNGNQNTVHEESEEESVDVEDAEKTGPSQLSVASHRESQPFDPEKELSPNCEQRSQFHKELEGQRPGSVDTDNFKGLRSESATVQGSGPKQEQLPSSQKEILPDETGIRDSQIDDKLSNGSVEAEGKTSEPLSQGGALSSNTPTQDSLEAGDAVTPCLFENESWETPVKKTYQKNPGNQQCPSITPRISRPFDTSYIAEAEKERIVNEAGLDKVISLDGSQAEASNAGQQLSSEVTPCPDANNKNLSSDTNTEGTQSFETSQSISVLHDLEFPPQEHDEDDDDDDDANCSKERGDRGKSSQIVDTAAHVDTTWIEPLPKKPRSSNVFTSSQELHPNVLIEHGSGTSLENPRDSECTESDVIPPTPPVKPVLKQVFISRSPSRLSCSKMRLQRKDEASCHSERLVVKPKRKVKSPRVSKSTKSQESERDRAATCNSLGSETSEDSISLLKNLAKSPEALDAQTMDLYPATQPDSNKQLDLSEDRNTSTSCGGNNMKNSPCKSPGESKTFVHVQSSSSGHEKDVSSNIVNEKEKCDSEASQDGRQRVLVKANKTRLAVDSDLHDVQDVESVHSSPSSPIKQRLCDIADSFDWSGTREQRKNVRDHHDRLVTANGENNKDDQHVRENAGKDDNDKELKDDDLEKSGGRNLHDNYRNCVVVDDDDNKDFPCSGGDEGVSTYTSDGGCSSGDEALLKPVFLPKETEPIANDIGSCNEDAENQEEEVAAFSQELIPSGIEGEDDDDGITSSYKALDSTGASSSTFLSEAAASTQKVEVLRQDVEAMEKEMEELRAYLAKTDKKREEGEETAEDDDMDYEEEVTCDEPDILPSLTPPPPLTPKSIPPMRQLSSPLKNVSRYLDQEGQSSDEGSDCEDTTRTSQKEKCERRKSSSNEEIQTVAEKKDADKTRTRKRRLSPNYEDDGLSITEVEDRQDGTPSPPRNVRSKPNSQENDDKELIVIDDRDDVHSKTGSLLLVKRRRVADELIPKKSPVVSLLFTRTRKDPARPSQSPRPVEQTKVPSPIKKKSTPFIYSRKRGAETSPVTRHDSPQPVSRDSTPSKGLARDGTSRESVSRDNVSRVHCRAAVPERTTLKVVTKANTSEEQETKNCLGKGTRKHLSFVATRLNRKQLAEARTLAETYGGKLASEFNSKTSHVIMATDENIQVSRHSYTMKYLMGLALGKWIVSHHWISACIQANALVAEADYEVRGDSGLGQAFIPRLARTARSKKEGSLLFEGFDVLCYGAFSTAVSKEQLGQLLKFCGARVYIDAEISKIIQKDGQKVVVIDKETRNNLDDINAICRQLNTKPVSLEWVTDSIANYKVQDLKDYTMES